MWDAAERILKRMCKLYKVTKKEVLGKSRKSWIVKARKACCKEMRLAGYTTTEIGHFLNRDHSTVVHHIRR